MKWPILCLREVNFFGCSVRKVLLDIVTRNDLQVSTERHEGTAGGRRENRTNMANPSIFSMPKLCNLWTSFIHHLIVSPEDPQMLNVIDSGVFVIAYISISFNKQIITVCNSNWHCNYILGLLIIYSSSSFSVLYLFLNFPCIYLICLWEGALWWTQPRTATVNTTQQLASHACNFYFAYRNAINVLRSFLP